MTALDRLSLNQITVDQLSLPAAIEAAAGAGVPWIGVWRHKLADRGAAEAGRLVRESGLRVSSLCRGGFFVAASESERRRRDADNRRALEEAAALDCDVLVLVCGPAENGDLSSARRQVLEGIERLVPHAAELGVRLGLEPLHPMLIGERSVVVSLAEANDLADRFDGEHVGVVIDAYHVFWDADIERQIARAADRILGFHVSDWVSPKGDVLACRAMMGDGMIDLRALSTLVDRTGYGGPIEVEVINRELWRRRGEEVVGLVVERYLSQVATAAAPS